MGRARGLEGVGGEVGLSREGSRRSWGEVGWVGQGSRRGWGEG